MINPLLLALALATGQADLPPEPPAPPPEQLPLAASPDRTFLEAVDRRSTTAEAELRAVMAERQLWEAKQELARLRGQGTLPMLVGIIGGGQAYRAEFRDSAGIRAVLQGQSIIPGWKVLSIDADSVVAGNAAGQRKVLRVGEDGSN